MTETSSRHVQPILRIDLGAISTNWAYLNQLASTSGQDNQAIHTLFPGPSSGGVVKANAYGLGAEKIFNALAAAGCRTMFVAMENEAWSVLRWCKDRQGPLQKAAMNAPQDQAVRCVLLGPVFGEAAAALLDAGCVPTLNSLEMLRDWMSAGLAGDIAIHIDTGMNRLGINADDVAQLLSDPSWLNSGLRPVLLMTHPLAADEANEQKMLDRTQDQRRQFSNLAEALGHQIKARFGQPPRLSFANSSAILRGFSEPGEMCRPGYALYGGNPVPERENPMLMAVRLEAPVLQLRTLCAGDTVGYGASYTAATAMTAATIGIGYGDGLPRQLGDGQASVSLNGAMHPLIGRVSMDSLTIAVQQGVSVEVGDLATLIGEDALSLEAVAQQANTIGYELLTRLIDLGPTSRLQRIYT